MFVFEYIWPKNAVFSHAIWLSAMVWIHGIPKKNATLFLSFPYVCPEPVLVKCSFLYINGSKSGVFRTKGVQRAVLQMAVE